jgi:outer membrane cobalamin receptor
MMLIPLLAAAATETVAVRSADDFDEVVVAATRLKSYVADRPANLTVLNRDEFEAEKPTQLSDLLRNVAGVHIDHVGGRGGTGSLYLRGADPNYTLVLVNGVRVNDPTNARGGSFDFSTFDIDDVQRVEIARGPYSAVYGGDALAGVINIVTRPNAGDDVRVTADAMAGAYGTQEYTLRAGGSDNRGGWTLGVGDSREGEVVRGNDFESQRISGSYDQDFAGTRLQLSARYADTDRATFPDDSGGYGFAAIRDTERRAAHESVFGAGISRDLNGGSLALTLGYFDRGELIDSPGVAPGIRDPFGIPPSLTDSDIERFSATVTGTHDFGKFLNLAYGAEYQHEHGGSEGQLDFGGGFLVPTNFELTRSSWAPFVEARVHAGDGFSAQAGVRVDKPDDYSAVTSPRLRVAYDFHGEDLDKFTIAAAWGKAFKLPSLYALGHPLVGNPDLNPERGESHEIELSQRLLKGAAQWSLTWFESTFRNAIDFDPGPPPMLVNRNRIDSHGFELAGKLWVGEVWKLDASVTQAKNRVDSTGGELRNRPEWRGGAGLHWTPTQPFTLSAAVTYVGSSLDSSIATGDVTLPSYTLVDMSASWQVSPKFEAYAAVDNLTDQQYEQFVGFEVRGIMPRVGVKLSL